MSHAAPLESAALNMVQCQIAPNGITRDDVLSAFLSVDRAAYAPNGFAAHALCDADLVVKGQLVLLNPLTMALMLQALAEQDGRGNVAVIGDDVGYVVDMIRTLGFAALPVVEESTLLNGAPWQAVLLNGAVSTLPAFLFSYLESGGLVLTVRQAADAVIGDVIAATTMNSVRVLGQAGAPMLTPFAQAESFSL